MTSLYVIINREVHDIIVERETGHGIIVEREVRDVIVGR